MFEWETAGDPYYASTSTVFTFTNSRTPKSASSRPKPLDFTPPKGSRGSDFTKSLTKHAPASIPVPRDSLPALQVLREDRRPEPVRGVVGDRARPPPPTRPG